MKIAFNGIGCGWGNNGGTQSVFRMADALNELGVETEMWAHCPSRFTWFNPKTPVRVCTLDDAPAVDVLINSGCNTTMDTYDYKRKKVGVQWLRGHETWARSDAELRLLYGLDMPLWVNSEWMTELREDAEVQYCGIPYYDFYNAGKRLSDGFRIGALWSSKPMKRTKDILEVAKDPRLKDVEWILFGNEPCPDGLPKNFEYHQQPDMITKRKIYSWCDVWFAPSVSEGLHIPPMEAAMCGATVVASAANTAGNMDYCIDRITGYLYNDLDEAVSKIDKLRLLSLSINMNNRMRQLIVRKIGNVETNAKRMIDRLEKSL